MPAAKSEPQLVEVVISHSAGGNVDILEYGKVKSNYGVFQSKKLVFGEDWTQEEAEAYAEDKRRELREFIDGLANQEFQERFDQSYLSS